MARIDAQAEFSDAQVFTATALSTNVLDLNQAIPQYAGGDDLFLTCKVNKVFAGGTSLRAVLWTDDTATVTDGADIISGDVILTAALTPGTSILTVNLKNLPLQQYIGVQYVVVGTMSGGGAVDAFLNVTPVAGAPDLS